MSQIPLHETGRRQLEKELVGVLRSAIDAHGPITRENASSAAKRVVMHLRAKGIWRDRKPLFTED